MTLGEWLELAARDLRDAGVKEPRRDALLLLAHATGLGKPQILAHPELSLAREAWVAAEEFLARRVLREPLQHITGVQEFWGLPVKVGPGCLIPRPETEHLVEAALAALAGRTDPAVAELGAGSACVLMALARERPDARLVGLEREEAALRWSRQNLSAWPRVLLVRADLNGRPPVTGLDVLVSNPPYITDGEWAGLEPEVREFEPASALRCGRDALGPYRALARWAAEALKPGGVLVCELGVSQARRAAALRRLHPGLAWRQGIRDLAGRLRVAEWEKR